MSPTTASPSGLRSALGWLACGLALGVGVGLIDGWLTVQAQRYGELGFSRLAAETLRDATFAKAWRVALGVVAIGGALAALRSVLSSVTAWALTVAGSCVAGLYFVARSLNDLPDFPAFFSLGGILANSALVMGFAILALGLGFAARWDPARRFGQALLGTPAIVAGAVAVAALLGVTVYASSAIREAPEAAEHILLITADTLRHDHLGSYGYPRDTSPNLDRLAARGTRFEHAVVQWPKTSPSFASLLTSLYGFQTGVVRFSSQPLPVRHVAIAEILREQGYATAGVVTNGNLARGYHFDQGFEHYVEIWREFPEQDAEQVTDAALEWLRGYAEEQDRPLFLWLHYVDPHAYYHPPPPYREEFVGDAHYKGDRHAPINPERDADMGGIPGRARLEDRTDLDYYVAEYDAEIRYMDEQIGLVLDAFEELGLMDETVVAFTADHGESLGEHDYFFEHGRLAYDASSRVPAIVAGPGVPKGRVVDRPVELIDVVPTLLDLAGLEPHPEAQGKSWRPLWTGTGTSAGPVYTFTEAGYNDQVQRALHTGRWKLIYVPDAADRAIMQGSLFELYDVQADPAETRNLIDVETEVAERMKQELFARIGDAPTSAPTRDVEVDGATEEALRALGYVD